MKTIYPLIVLLLLPCAIIRAQPAGTGHIQDTLPPAIKYERGFHQIPGNYFHTKTSFILDKALSPVGESDFIKYAMTLPGVASGAEGFSSMYVRGGNMGNNAVCLDGTQLFGYSHLLGLTMSVPVNAIESADFSVGGFDGDKMNLTASSLDLRTKENDFSSKHFNTSISNMFVGAEISAPIIKDKLSIFATGRYSILGPEYSLVKSIIGQASSLPEMKPVSFDFLGKLGYRPNNKSDLSLTLFSTVDRYAFIFPPDSKLLMATNTFLGILKHSFTSNRTTVESSASFNWFLNRQQQDAVVLGHTNDLKLQTQINEITLKTSVSHYLSDRSSLKSGINAKFASFQPGSAKYSESTILIVPNQTFTTNNSSVILSSAYLQYNYDNPDRYGLMACIRGSYFINYPETDNEEIFHSLNPEFSTRLYLNIYGPVGIEATYDYVSQYYHTLEGFPLGWSMDLIVPSSSSILPEKASQFYAGLFFKSEHHKLNAGAFHKNMKNLIFYSDASAIFSAAAAGWKDNIEIGAGFSKGLELYYDCSYDKLRVTSSYTLSKSERVFPNIANGVAFPAKFDRRHILNSSLEYTVRDEKDSKHKLAVSFTYQSGNWESVSSGKFQATLPDDDYVAVNYFSHPNNLRLPYTSRLDLGYNITLVRKYHHSITFGVFNILNRQNPFLIFFDTDSLKWKQFSLIPIMPNFKYSVSF